MSAEPTTSSAQPDLSSPPVALPLTSGSSSTPSGHLLRLDIIRGIAILGVFLFHMMYAVFGMDNLEWSGNWRDLSAIPDPAFAVFYGYTFGWIGVKIFFVLSGFCIHLSFLRWATKQQPILSGSGWANTYIFEFVQRRFWRIYPAYLVALLLFSVLRKLDFSNPTDSLDFGLHLLLIHNLDKATYFGGINGSFWSIAVEWQLYLIYPLVILAWPKWDMSKIILGVFVLTFALVQLQINPDLYLILKLPFFYWLEWILGAFLAEAWIQGRRIFVSVNRWAVFALLTGFIVSTLYHPLSELSYPLSTLLSGMGLEWYIHQHHPLKRWEKGLAGLGTISYSVYLLHQPFLPQALAFLHRLEGIQNPFLDLTLNAGIILIPILGLSVLSYYFIELKGIELGRWTQAALTRQIVFPVLNKLL